MKLKDFSAKLPSFTKGTLVTKYKDNVSSVEFFFQFEEDGEFYFSVSNESEVYHYITDYPFITFIANINSCEVEISGEVSFISDGEEKAELYEMLSEDDRKKFAGSDDAFLEIFYISDGTIKVTEAGQTEEMKIN